MPCLQCLLVQDAQGYIERFLRAASVEFGQSLYVLQIIACKCISVGGKMRCLCPHFFAQRSASISRRLGGEFIETLRFLIDDSVLPTDYYTRFWFHPFLESKDHERNTTIPAKKSQIYSTAADSQTQVEIHVLQGERPMAQDNKSLGRFILDGIPPAPRGVPQIEVTFDIDANGILNVSAQDKASGREQKITITASSGLSDKEVDQMVKEAEKHAEEDARRREQVEVRNQAEGAVFSAEKFIRDYGDKLPEDAKTRTQELIAEVEKAKDSGNTQETQSAVENLMQYLQTLGGQMYEQPGAAAPGPDMHADGSGAPEDEDVIDAEFTDA